MEANNMAAMREALEEMLEKIDAWRTDGTMDHWQYSQLFDICDAALSAPARNCDVGTMEEQAERFIEFCAGHLCDNCPNSRAKRCGVGWSQMPFAPAEGDSK